MNKNNSTGTEIVWLSTFFKMLKKKCIYVWNDSKRLENGVKDFSIYIFFGGGGVDCPFNASMLNKVMNFFNQSINQSINNSY